MFTHEISINMFLLGLVPLVAGLIGYGVRSAALGKAKRKIDDLEREIMDHYETILDLEKESAQLSLSLQDIKSPVIAMKPVARETRRENNRMPDISLRKQLLAKIHAKHQSASGQ